MRRLWAVIVAAILLFGAGLGLHALLRGSSPQTAATHPAATAPPPSTILLMGVDKRPGWKLNATRSDVMIVLHVDAKTGRLVLLSVPRDTRVDLSRYGIQKINAAFPFGGPDLAMRTVGDLIGTKIHYYAWTNFSGFVAIINALGGVTVDVPKRMYYKASDVTINLYPGVQHLDGQQVLELVRFRHTLALGDIGREQNQEAVLHALFKEAMSLGTILRLPILVPTLYTQVHTNLSLGQLVSLAKEMRHAKHMTNAVMPGAFLNLPGDSQWYVDPLDAKKVWTNLLEGKKPTSLFDPTAVTGAQDILEGKTPPP